MSLQIESDGPERTERIGYEIGRLAAAGLVVALRGDLGAGKTLLTKGIARGLAVPNPQYVTSPTFTIHKLYKGRLTLNHLDFYRLGAEAELEDLGVEEALGGSGVCVVEWPDHFFSFLGTERLDISIEVTGETSRSLEITWCGELATSVGAALLQRLANGEKRDDL
jgi:tRNA threonylcarbamoyladenosine biosynthesis protein TsaE